MKTKVLIYFLLFVTCKSIYSSEKIIYLDGDNYVSLGISDQKNEVLANTDACNSARRELMSFVFGSGYQINQNMIKSLGQIDYSQDVTTNSGQIVLRSVQTEISRTDEITKCILKYPRSEAELEKQRAVLVNPKNAVHFSETGSSGKIRSGNLEILSTPDEANVFIDNIRWGVTPLKLNSMLLPGKHLIRIDHANYKTIEEEVTVSGISKIYFNKILKRATARLNIVTEPENAKVQLNGVSIGNSPLRDIEVIAGQKINLNIVHDEAEVFSQEIAMERDEIKTLDLKLSLKQSFASFNVYPAEGAIVTADNDKTIPLNMFYPIGPGSHEIIVTKNGYDTQKFYIDLKGGESKATPTINLTVSKVEVAPVAIEEVKPRIPEVPFETRYQFSYRPVTHSFNNVDFYILPIDFNIFTSKRFSTGIGYHLAQKEKKYIEKRYGDVVTKEYIKNFCDISINEMFWPIKNNYFSLGFGPELSYREISYDNDPSSLKLKKEKTTSIGGTVDLQIPLYRGDKVKVFGIDANYRRISYGNKLESSTIGIYFEYD